MKCVKRQFQQAIGEVILLQFPASIFGTQFVIFLPILAILVFKRPVGGSAIIDCVYQRSGSLLPVELSI